MGEFVSTENIRPKKIDGLSTRWVDAARFEPQTVSGRPRRPSFRRKLSL